MKPRPLSRDRLGRLLVLLERALPYLKVMRESVRRSPISSRDLEAVVKEIEAEVYEPKQEDPAP